ncbi:MAG: SMC-Scp complex subunit ScpB [bacterium]|nr:SMC-Scp complex subunit ScpB [bacterium]
MPLDAQIEAILFWKGEPMKVKKLAAILDKTDEEIQAGLAELGKKIEGRGVQLIVKEDEVMLGTHNELGTLIESLIKEELMRDLGKAGLETLSIILYRGPVTRRDIDYIRGVNSNFILRNLLVRGLVEKVTNPQDERSFLYKPTFQLLSFLGISNIEELPEYTEVRKEIENHHTANLDEPTQQEDNQPHE